MTRAWVAVALAGSTSVCLAQPSAAPSPQQAPPPRWLAHVTMHPGVAMVSDELDDGASSPGVALGFQAGVQFRITPVLSVGAGLDATFSQHESDASASAEAKYTNYFVPTVVGRLELGRFAISSWGGYHVGHRSVREPGGVFNSKQYSANDLSGLVVAGAALVRVRPPVAQPIHFEIGPFVQAALLSTDAETSIRSLVIGLVFQVAFNAPPVQGDTF
jgi:hypothetical protein